MRTIGKGILMGLGLVLAALPVTAVIAATNLTGIDHAGTGDGGVRISLNTTGDTPEVSVFSTESPSRIVLDLADTENQMGSGEVAVGLGSVQRYSAIEAGGRTRLVIDLSRPVTYEYDTSAGQVVLTIAGEGSTAATYNPAGNSDNTVAGVDFRRGELGQGRVIINMEYAGAGYTLEETGGKLILDIHNSRLPEQLDRIIDVSDFATPVQLIDAAEIKNGVRVIMTISGPIEHMAYESDQSVIVEVTEYDELSLSDSEFEKQFFEDKEYEGTRVTFNFQDIPVRSVLQLIADVSNLNIVVADTVDGNLTLRLTNVPWDQALDIVMDARNLDVRENGNVLWIGPTMEIAAREQELLQARLDRRVLEPLQTVLIPVSYAKASALAGLIQQAASPVDSEYGLLSERGSVAFDERTNTLMVTDTSEQIAKIRELVTDLDYAVQQVQIESRIVIAKSDFAHELGVRFGVNYLHSGSNIGVIAADGRAAEGIRDSGLVDYPSFPNNYQVNLPSTSDKASTIGFSFLTGNVMLDLELSALESEGEGEVISTPRVVTANQAEAYIRQGVEIPYEEATSSGATAVSFKRAVLELKVTPLITPDGRVQLDLDIKQDTVGEIFQTSRGGSVPSIDTRNLNTTVLVANGDTVVLGGIFQDENNSNEDKVPWLGDIPVVGILFRRRANETKKRELLIFVTPSIVEDRPKY